MDSPMIFLASVAVPVSVSAPINTRILPLSISSPGVSGVIIGALHVLLACLFLIFL